MDVIARALPWGEVVVERATILDGSWMEVLATSGAEARPLNAAEARGLIWCICAAWTATLWEGTVIGENDDGGPVVGEGTAEGVGERWLRREADERGEDGRVDGEESGGLVLGGVGEGTRDR